MARSQFGPINPRAPFIWHGGDYNPEQWPPETWDTDVALMQQSHFNVATVGVFSYATYGDDFYAGTPAVTENHFGDGWAYYLASDPEDSLLDTFYKRLLAAYAITPLLTTPPGVEVTLRQTERQDLLFILNHNPAEATIGLPAGARYADRLRGQEISGNLRLAGYDVRILATERG